MAAVNHNLTNSDFLLPPALRVASGLLIYLLLSHSLPSFSQVCTDPGGPLVINQDFGSSGYNGFVAALTPYQYEAADCPNDGQYSIVSSLNGTCFNSTWYGLSEDHTPGDIQGNMMIVNGGSAPGVFYQQPVLGLCSGTSYEVSVWVANILRINTCSNALVPNLSVRIETQNGTLVQSTALGMVGQTAAPLWKRLSMVFTAPTNTTDFVVKLYNNQGGFGCGNDMVIDDFQVRQCSECVGVPELVYIPDAFTPNKDGVNETLAVYVRPSASASFRIQIYDRWGSLVFVSTNPDNRWDGTCGGVPCLAGQYAWVVSHRSGVQAATNHTQTGRVLLIRHE